MGESCINAEEFFNSLPKHHAAPLWTVLNAVNPPRPAPRAVPNLWKYKELRPPLMEAGRIVTAEEAERRVLMLVNPSMKAPYTTDTLYAGLQLILPGETAPAHRHRGFALRFIIEGDRGFTAVEGQKVYMKKGDLILTPSWHWHDHGHEGQEPMIWLDGLDIPLLQTIPINFAEEYEDHRYPSKPTLNSAFRFAWNEVRSALDAPDGTYAMHIYKNAHGAEVSRTLGAHAERIQADTSSPARQETCSFVFHCVDGSGSSQLVLSDGTETVLKWSENDTFAVPAWTTIRHRAIVGQDAYLFAFSDRPLVKSIGWYVEKVHPR